MTIVLLILLIALTVACLSLLIVNLVQGAKHAQANASQASEAGQAVNRIEGSLRADIGATRGDFAQLSKDLRTELTGSVTHAETRIMDRTNEAFSAQKRQLDTFADQLRNLTDANEKRLTEIRTTVELKLKDSIDQDRQGRAETAATLSAFRDSLVSQLGDMATAQRGQLEQFSNRLSELTQSHGSRMENLRLVVDERLKAIQEDTNAKLEQMRLTVDEKLQTTLERRLSESFRMVSERLENVQKGLGEMQALATNVGDLKKVLANVSTRGSWGEVRLGGLLEQILSPEQYEADVHVKPGSSEQVEYAIKLPGKDPDGSTVVWLPIDAKFPLSVFERLTEALENGDPVEIESAASELEANVKGLAKLIHGKYVCPPHTTDFAIMFLPVEGLYAEVLRRKGLSEFLQREYRIAVAGPTTLAALLNSLQMGFRTLAIEKRSSEVWQLLGAIKTEFGRFGDILDKVHRQLETASNTIGSARGKTKTIERKLKGVEELTPTEARLMLDEGRRSEDDTFVMHEEGLEDKPLSTDETRDS